MLTFAGYGIGNPVIYWLLRILLLCILIYCGWGISYDNSKKFTKYAWIAGLSYSLIQGLRWLRGADYPHYYDDIVTLLGKYSGGISNGEETIDPEPLYELWCNIFYYSGLPFWLAFIIYSALLIGGVIIVLKKMPNCAIWVLPIFFLLTQSSENIIRQYIAVSFLLYAIYFYLNNEKIKMVCSLVAIILIHFSGIIAIAAFLFIIIIPEKVFNILEKKNMIYIYIGLFVFVYFFWDISKLSTFADWLGNNLHFADDSKGAYYIDDADRWFSDEGSMSNVLGKKAAGVSMLNQTITFLTYSSIIYYGFRFISIYKKYRIFFYLSYAAIIVKTIGGDVEMFTRIYHWLVVFIPFLIGLYMVNGNVNKNIKYCLYGIYGLFFLWFAFISNIFTTSMFGYGFIWDKY